MSTARRIRLLAVASCLAVGLTVSALSGAAVAMPERANVLVPVTPEEAGSSTTVATPRTFERPGSSVPRDDAARERSLAVARAQERYYSSYGSPGRAGVPQPAVGSHDETWLVIALSVLGATGVLVAGAVRLRRVRIRRRLTADVQPTPAPAPRLAR